jgi:hypothetical protein
VGFTQSPLVLALPQTGHLSVVMIHHMRVVLGHLLVALGPVGLDQTRTQVQVRQQGIDPGREWSGYPSGHKSVPWFKMEQRNVTPIIPGVVFGRPINVSGSAAQQAAASEQLTFMAQTPPEQQFGVCKGRIVECMTQLIEQIRAKKWQVAIHNNKILLPWVKSTSAGPWGSIGLIIGPDTVKTCYVETAQPRDQELVHLSGSGG